MSFSDPIGIFDSGIGGLTVVRELTGLMPSESVVYLGDTARVPYGIRSPETVKRYAREGMRFLMSRGIKFLVVACNTVSAVGLTDLSREVDVPVVGVLEPGAKAAAMKTSNGKVGVIGTSATIRSGAYARAIHSMKADIEVKGQACPLFVPLVEEGWLDGQVPELAAERYLKEIKSISVDTLVLGCTHYPLLKKVVSRVMGEGVSLIDSAEETALEVQRQLKSRGIENKGSDKPVLEFCVTDSPEMFKAVGENFLGETIDNITKVKLEVVRGES